MRGLRAAVPRERELADARRRRLRPRRRTRATSSTTWPRNRGLLLARERHLALDGRRLPGAGRVARRAASPTTCWCSTPRPSRRSARSTARARSPPCTRARSTRSRARPGSSSASTTRTAAPTRGASTATTSPRPRPTPSVRVLRLERRRARDARGPSRRRPRAAADEDCSVWRGEVHVTTLATQYKKIRFYTRENVGAEDIHLPPEELDTEAFVLTLVRASGRSSSASRGGDRGAAWRGVGRAPAPRRAALPALPAARPRASRREVRSPHFAPPGDLPLRPRAGRRGLCASSLFRGAPRGASRPRSRSSRAARASNGCPACVGPRRGGRAAAARRRRAACSRHLAARRRRRAGATTRRERSRGARRWTRTSARDCAACGARPSPRRRETLASLAAAWTRLARPRGRCRGWRDARARRRGRARARATSSSRSTRVPRDARARLRSARGRFAAAHARSTREHAHGDWRSRTCSTRRARSCALARRGDPALARARPRRAPCSSTSRPPASRAERARTSFLVGLGASTARRFELWQGFLRAPGEERALLAEVRRAHRARLARVVSLLRQVLRPPPARGQDARARHRAALRGAAAPRPLPPAAGASTAAPSRDGRLATLERALCGVERGDDLSGRARARGLVRLPRAAARTASKASSATTATTC